MSFKNQGVFETEEGTVTRQKGQGRVRLRFDLDGCDQHIYVPLDRLAEFADLVDDVCDAVADGLWERTDNGRP